MGQNNSHKCHRKRGSRGCCCTADASAGRVLGRAVRDDRWKLIRYPQVNQTQLFDLKTDPDERTNLAGDPAHAAKITELTALLEKEMQHDGDLAPLTVPNPKPAKWTPPAKKPAANGKAAAEH